MTTGALALVLAAFLASAVETVEALTIVLAVGVTRGWRSTTAGIAAALAALTVLVALVGQGRPTAMFCGPWRGKVIALYEQLREAYRERVQGDLPEEGPS